MIVKYEKRTRRRSTKNRTIKKRTTKMTCNLKLTGTSNETTDGPSDLSADINLEHKESEGFRGYCQSYRKHFFNWYRKMQFVN